MFTSNTSNYVKFHSCCFDECDFVYFLCLFCMGRAVTNVERTCGPTQLPVEVAMKYV